MKETKEDILKVLSDEPSPSLSDSEPAQARNAPWQTRLKPVERAETEVSHNLLSKILSSVVNTLNVETALKLAVALDLPPQVVLEATARRQFRERFGKRDRSRDVT